MSDSRQLMKKASNSFEPQSTLSPMFQRRPFAAEPEEDLDEQEATPIQARLDTFSAAPFDMGGMSLYSSGTPAYPVQRKSEEGDFEEEEPEDFTLQRRVFTSLVQRQEDDFEEEEESSPLKSSIQAKLTIGEPGDRYEQEADAMAAQVMKMPEPQADDEEDTPVQRRSQISALVQRRDDESEEALAQLKPNVQAKGNKASAPNNFESRLAQKKGGGSPLPQETKGFMESRFGADFSGVRVHEAPKEASDIGAQAFTHGQDIYFNSGKYNPGSSSGKELLAHELTHTIQQTGPQIAAKNSSDLNSAKKANKETVQTKVIANLSSLPAVQLREAPEQESAESQQAEPPTQEQAPPQTESREQPAAAPPAQEQAQPPAPEQTEQAPAQSQPATETAGGGGASGESGLSGGESSSSEAAPTQNDAGQQAVAKGGAKQKQGKAKQKAAAGGSKAPASPQADPDFQAAVAQSGAAATDKKQHNPAEAESQTAQAASESSDQEIEGQAQDLQVAAMEQEEGGSFNAEDFKSKVMEQVDAVAPDTLEDADKFSNSGLLGKVKEKISNKAKEAGEEATNPVTEKAAEEPSTEEITPRESIPLEEPDLGTSPAIDSGAAKPKSKPDSEVSAPMQAESQNLDQQMADADITEEQLANSNEPEFVGALSSKNEAQTKATEAPQIYRQQEQATLSSAQAEAQNIGQTTAEGMQSQRESAMGQLQSLQGDTKSQDEQKRADVASHIDGIYQETKTSVETTLNGLEGEVMSRFNTGADEAKKAYEDYVKPHMKEYKKRYDGLGGGAQWVVDKVLGVPEKVTRFFSEGRQKYLEKMDLALTDISQYVTDQLNLAKDAIAEGRQKIQDYVDGLPTDLQQVGQEAASNIQSQFDELEQNVDNKHSELVNSLSQAYIKNVQELDARIDEMKASNQPFFAKAFDALTGVAETINNLKNMLTNVLAKAGDVVGNIIKDPIGFVNNLVSGVTQGLNNFLGNIWEHLQGGLVGWLTGALGPMGITIPEDIFSLPGIFSLVTQVLGLTWDYVRGKAVNMFGETTVGAMEQGVEMFQVIKERGLEGMWEQVQEDFTDLKATVMDQIKNMVITQVITAGIKWIIGLLNPASAFVKACMAIYDIVMFFVNQGSQIIELVNAVVDSIAAIANGAVGGAAQMVEQALVKALPVAIGFLASLLGISGLAKKVQTIIKKIRKRIDKAINKLLKKAKKLFQKNNKQSKNSQKDIRSDKEKKDDLKNALSDSYAILQTPNIKPEDVDKKLPAIQSEYNLTYLKLIQDSNSKYYIDGKVNPEGKTPDVTLSQADEDWEKAWKAKQQEVGTSMQKFVPRFQSLDPTAEVHVKGSLAAGVKLNPKKRSESGEPYIFNPTDFDIDAYIVSDKLFTQGIRNGAQARKPGEIVGSKSRIPGFNQIIKDMRKELSKISGNRNAGENEYKFNVYIRTTKNTQKSINRDKGLAREIGIDEERGQPMIIPAS